jgi:hypothetical protein
MYLERAHCLHVPSKQKKAMRSAYKEKKKWIFVLGEKPFFPWLSREKREKK